MPILSRRHAGSVTLKTGQIMKPIAKKMQIISERLPEETIVYDLKRHRAHCLNRIASAVWRRCDGATDVSEIARRLQAEDGLSADEALVHVALQELVAAKLVEPGSVGAPAAPLPSRREIARKLSIGSALAAPLVMSIVAPTPAMAQSRVGGGPGRPPGGRRRR
jgi:hypothetical protein